MTARLWLTAWLAGTLCVGAVGPVRAQVVAAQTSDDNTQISELLTRLEQVIERGDPAGYAELLTSTADRGRAEQFTTIEFRPGVTDVVIQERERLFPPGGAAGSSYRLTLDAFIQYGDRGRIATWQVDVSRMSVVRWGIAEQRNVSGVDRLYRLRLSPQKQFDARNFTILGEDLELRLLEGSVFVVETEQGITGLVLVGRGEMNFHPAPDTEKGQIRILSGSDVLTTRFDEAFVRIANLNAHADVSALVPRAVDPDALRRAQAIFQEESAKSYVVDLTDLSPDTWWLLPSGDDMLAEVRTRQLGTLTYVRSGAEPEDISLFERGKRRNICVYASKSKLAARGRFYSEDDQSPVDVLEHEIDVAVEPDRQWIEGRATMRLRVRARSISQLTIRLADPLVVRSVVSNQYGRLFSMRVKNQDMLLVNLPITLVQDSEITVSIEYAGRLPPQPPEAEVLQGVGGRSTDWGPSRVPDPFVPTPDPAFLYSTQTYWYPQNMVSDYATATMQITIPADYDCVASGAPASYSPTLAGADASGRPRKVYFFIADRPLRYLSFLVTRLARADRFSIGFSGAPDANTPKPMINTGDYRAPDDYDKLDLIVETHPRLASQGRAAGDRAADILEFYQAIIGDSPYSTLSIALIESSLPGGHSPAYVAVLNQTLPSSGVTWRGDPAAFSGYPEFFLAHEIAHQWWGQAVAGRNYHEQWISEAFAQYFAALYAQHTRGDGIFDDVMRQMRQWAVDESDQGPVYLGYRVGHIRQNGKAFRAIVYNKGASVLHMLRQLIGDDAFFKGIRRFYATARYTKAGTDNLRLAMEAESGRSLDRFFDRWIYAATLPSLGFSYQVAPAGSGEDVVLHFDQAGEIFDVPVTVVLQYDNRRETVVVPVTAEAVDWRVPLKGRLRSAEVRRDGSLLDSVTRR